MKTKTKTIEVIDEDSITFPIFLKDEITGRTVKLFSKFKSVRASVRDNANELYTQDFTSSANITCSDYDNFLRGEFVECTEQEFENNCLQAIANIQEISMNN